MKVTPQKSLNLYFTVDDDIVTNVTTTELPASNLSTSTPESPTTSKVTQPSTVATVTTTKTSTTTEVVDLPKAGEEITTIFAQVYDADKQKYELLISEKGSKESEIIAEETEVITDMVYHEEKACLFIMKGSPLNGTKITKRCEGSPKKWDETVIATHTV